MTLEEQLEEQAKRGLMSLGLEEDTADTWGPWAALAAQFIPGVGEGVGVDLTRDAIQDERYGDAAIEGGLTLLGAVPIVGDFAAAAIKGIRRAPTSLLDDAVDANPFPGVRRKDMSPDDEKTFLAWQKRERRRNMTPEQADRERASARRSHQKNLDERKAKQADYRKNNAEALKAKRDADYADPAKGAEIRERNRDWARQNKESVNARNKAARDKRKELDPAGESLRNKEAQARHKEKDPVAWRGKKANAQAKRRASLLERTPSWADPDKIDEIFDTAAEISSRTGVPHEVDHVIPLQGRNVSGLHHQDNLLVVPMKQNRSKHNAFEPGDLPPRAGVRKSRAYLKKLKEAQEAARRK